MTEEKKKVSLKIVIDDRTAGGAYSNGAIVNFSETEFILDFVMLQPQAPQAKVVARVITSPAHAKRLAQVLADNVARYEQQFGEIKTTVAADKPIKFIQ